LPRKVPLPYLEATNSRINIKNGSEKLPFSLVETDVSLAGEPGTGGFVCADNRRAPT